MSHVTGMIMRNCFEAIFWGEYELQIDLAEEFSWIADRTTAETG